MFYKISFVCLALIAGGVNGYTSGGGYSSFGSTGGLSSFGSYGGGADDQKSSYGGAAVGGQDFSQPQVIEVSPDQLPVQVHFRTASSRMNVQQSHGAQPMPQVEHASFQDEPHRVVHEVVKPVIQEVREIIQPYRRVTQEIRPVIEEVHTVVHKGENRRAHGVGSGMQQKGYSGQYKSKAAKA